MPNNDRIKTSDYDDYNYNYNFTNNNSGNNKNKNNNKLSGGVKLLLIILTVIVVISCLTNVGVLYYYNTVANSEKKSTITPTNINDVAAAVANNNMNSVVRINISSSKTGTAGTGFVVNDEGYIVTNYHVAQYLNTYGFTGQVYFDWTDIPFSIEWVNGNETEDIAVVKMGVIRPSASEYKVVTFLNRAQKLNYGEKVVAIGNPLNLGFSVTEGIVSSPRLTIEDTLAIQHTAEINAGNSGGPLYNKEGAVVGINSFKAAKDGNGNVVEGMAYAIPNETTLRFLENWGIKFTESELK